MSETELAYAAGIIDGEGCLRIAMGSKRSACKEGRMALTLNVANTHKPLLLWFQDRWGGHLAKKRRTEAHHKPCWYWMATGKRAAGVLQEVLPYLLIKQRDAEMALLFAETYHNNDQWRDLGNGRQGSFLNERAKRLRNMVFWYFKNDSTIGRRRASKKRS